MVDYRPRIADRMLADLLLARGAVLVEGPKWCGKTTTAAQQAASVLDMADPASRAQNLALAELEPDAVLAGARPRLIDEWQVAPGLWDAVRHEVDQRSATGQFILTGSSVPPSSEAIVHSGVGRIARLRMRPMSLAESGDSSGAVSLGALFAGQRVGGAAASASLRKIAGVLCRGGWPQSVDSDERVGLIQARAYVDEVVESDISRVDGVRRDPESARRLMRSYARMTASQARTTQIVADVEGGGGGPSDKTVRAYLTALEQIFVIEDLPAWNPNLRSKAAVRSTATRHFVDPSIAAASLGAGPDGLMKDLESFGLLFESMCVRDLRVYADALDGKVWHYRDSTGLEADAVVTLRDGRYGLVEVKLGGQRLVEEGAASLVRLSQLLDTSRMPAPSFLMVLTATGTMAYTRPDGVAVVPISTLGP